MLKIGFIVKLRKPAAVNKHHYEMYDGVTLDFLKKC
jgi:hypothetical protein